MIYNSMFLKNVKGNDVSCEFYMTFKNKLSTYI
jgi:hypothetical protein